MLYGAVQHMLGEKYPMGEQKKLTKGEIDAINKLMERKSEIILEPRKNGYLIYESKKKLIFRADKENTTE